LQLVDIRCNAFVIDFNFFKETLYEPYLMKVFHSKHQKLCFVSNKSLLLISYCYWHVLNPKHFWFHIQRNKQKTSKT